MYPIGGLRDKLTQMTSRKFRANSTPFEIASHMHIASWKPGVTS